MSPLKRRDFYPSLHSAKWTNLWGQVIEWNGGLAFLLSFHFFFFFVLLSFVLIPTQYRPDAVRQLCVQTSIRIASTPFSPPPDSRRGNCEPR
jgi:hypothetical protein